MKAVIVLVVLLALVVGGVYFFGGYRTLDPDKQGNTLKAAIKPGMTWNAVLALPAGDRPRFQTVTMVKQGGGLAAPVDGPEKDLDAGVKGKISNGQYADGFKFVYRFSEKVAFQVEFDRAGKVQDVQDIRTIADLLQTR